MPRKSDHELELEALRAEARYRRERYDLYRAKSYSGRPTMDSRLRELERASIAAQARLTSALRRDETAD